MTGPEHYEAAEGDLESANEFGPDDRDEEQAFFLRRAQVHATLAHAAATALGLRGMIDNTPGGMHRTDFEAWVAVAGAQRS